VGVRLSPRPLSQASVRSADKFPEERSLLFLVLVLLVILILIVISLLHLLLPSIAAIPLNPPPPAFTADLRVQSPPVPTNSFDTRPTRGTMIQDLPTPRRPSRDASAWLVPICRLTKTATNHTVLPLALNPSPGQFQPPGKGDALTANRWHHHDRFTRTGDTGRSRARSLRSYRCSQKPSVSNHLALAFSAAPSKQAGAINACRPCCPTVSGNGRQSTTPGQKGHAVPAERQPSVLVLDDPGCDRDRRDYHRSNDHRQRRRPRAIAMKWKSDNTIQPESL
jgi:hypothetical protein